MVGIDLDQVVLVFRVSAENTTEINPFTSKLSPTILEAIEDAILPVENNLHTSVADDVLYAGNTGLVLLWPFLTRFFERFDLIVHGQFGSTTNQQQAVTLLQMMATGQLAMAEYQLLVVHQYIVKNW